MKRTLSHDLGLLDVNAECLHLSEGHLSRRRTDAQRDERGRASSDRFLHRSHSDIGAEQNIT
jgi:hypothetical protein